MHRPYEKKCFWLRALDACLEDSVFSSQMLCPLLESKGTRHASGAQTYVQAKHNLCVCACVCVKVPLVPL